MLKIKNHHRFIFSALIFLLVLASVYVRKKNASPIRDGELIRLPDFVSTDITGNKIKSADFKGKYLYVQFIRPIDENNINLFNKVYSNWKDKDLRFLIIGKRYDQINSNMKIDSTKAIILINDYDKLKSLFNAPEYGTHYLFDTSKLKIFHEKNYIEYENGIKKYLIQAIDKDNFSISKFIKENENINNIDWFDQLSHVVQKEKHDYYVISMFSSFCYTCAPGLIIEWLKNIHSKSKKSTYVLCILSDKYNESDIAILKSQLRISFPVVIANGLLSQKWNSFINHYSEVELNSIVFIMDNSGHILKVLDPNCKTCWKPFFNRLNSMVLK